MAGEQRPEDRKRRGGVGKERLGLLSRLAHLWYVALSLFLADIPQRQRPRREAEVPHCSGGVGVADPPVHAGASGVSTGTAVPRVSQSHKKVKRHLYLWKTSLKSF